MTIRLRLTLWYTALLGATLVFFSVIVYSALATNLQTQLIQESERRARDISRAISTQIERDLGNLQQGGDLEFPNINYFAISVGVQVVSLEGLLVKQSSNLMNMKVPNFEQALPAISENKTHRYITSEASGSLLVYSAPLVIAGRIAGAVQIVRPMGAALNALSQVSRYLIIGTGLSLIVAAVVGAFLARRELLPLAEITRTASRINRAKDLDLRLNLADSDSEIGELASTFNDMLDRIQQLFVGQERLVADVSHDLRTPLTTIQGNMELLQRMALKGDHQNASEDPELFREIVYEVENETSRMGRMINDLLLLAQADSGVLKLQMEPVEMDTLLLDVYRQTQRMAEIKRGSGALDIRLGSEDQALVLGDRERLRQLLLNLTDNAIKYTPSGGSVTLGLENLDGWVKVAVRDTGIGILPEQQQHIFDRFYRTDKARTREGGGSGLGLSIVLWLAQAHNGRVTVESVPQQGSTFTLWLPEHVPAGSASANGDRPLADEDQEDEAEPLLDTAPL